MNWGAWTWAAWASVILLACSDSSQVDGDGDEAIGAIHQSAMKGTPGAAVGDADYCGADNSHLCALGEGPCTSTGQCASGLTCIPGNLAKRGPYSGGACAPSTCSNGSIDPGETSIDCGGSCGSDCTVTCDAPNGSSNKCNSDCRCGVGEGQCDTSAECQPGLVCGVNNGALFQLGSTVDVCWAATCQNGVKDGNETAVDCGGSCAPCTPPPAAPIELAAVNTGALLQIVVAPHTDQTLHGQILTIANDLRDKLNAIKGDGGTPFSVNPNPTNVPSGISLGINGDFVGSGWPYEGYFRPNDTLAGGQLRPDRLALKEQYVLRTPQGANRVIVAGATVDALRAAVWDLLAQAGYRHYFPTPTWEVIPSDPRVRLPALAIDERPAILSRTLSFPANAWDTAFVNTSDGFVADWRKHNRLNQASPATELTPKGGGSFGSIVNWWQTKYGVTFPPELSTNPTVSVTQRQLCLTGAASAAGQTWTVEKVIKEWATAQTTSPLTLSPYDGVDWTSAPKPGGGLYCNDINDPTFNNIANRMAAILNAAAEAQPTKLITATFRYHFSDAPTLALRQNVFVNIDAYYPAQTSFALENRLRNWGSTAGFEVGLQDDFGQSTNDFPGQVRLSTKSILERISTFYGLGARRYDLNVYTGFGAAGPTWWALSKAFWELDTPQIVDSNNYRNDFLTNAFGPAKEAMNAYYAVIEDRALWSENLVGVMYRALDAAFAATNPTDHPKVRARLEDLAVYTRYLELSRRFWNRCDAQSPASEQSQLRDLLRFTYATRDRRILLSRDVMAEINRLVPNCTSGEAGLGMPACDLPQWGVNCPGATGCGSTNPMKEGPVPSSSELSAFAHNGALSVPVLDTALIKDFSRDLVPYSLGPALPARLESIYTMLPHYLFVQRPSAAGPLTAHVRRNGTNYILSGRLSALNGPSSASNFRFFSKGGTATETDWVFGNATSDIYRLDLDDQGNRMWTTFPEQTRVAVPIGRNDSPLALNYRWTGYFLVPAGTDKIVGWSQADSTFYRNKKNTAGTAWITEPARYLSDYTIGHACTNPRGGGGDPDGLWDHFIIPITSAAPTDEIWYFNWGTSGAIGERVLLNIPPYLYQSPETMLVPREVSPEGTHPTPCTSDASCTAAQYCSQAGTCRTAGGGCTETAQCAPGQACTSGECSCADTSACSASCRCGVGGSCDSDNECVAGLGCDQGRCDCTNECAAKACGDDPATSCGTLCPALCSGGEPGCGDNADCPAGFVCGHDVGDRFGFGSGTNVCWPAACSTQTTLFGATPPSGCGQAPACVPDCSKNHLVDGCGGYCRELAAREIRGPGGAAFIPELMIPRDGQFHPSPLPPQQTAAVGALPGIFEVTDRGTANYTIPIQVPPGRGVEPSLSIKYVGTHENGMLGVGWGLTGLSSISRCRSSRTQPPFAIRPVMLDDEDRFCLDGEMLVQVNATGGVAYGADGAEYVLEKDSTKLRITSHADGTVRTGYFTVLDRAGKTLTFGTNDAAVVASNGVRRVWALEQVDDTSGNVMTIRYARIRTIGEELGSGDAVERDTGELLPSQISYGGYLFGNGGNATRFVTFDYEKRTDPVHHYVAGDLGFSTWRLKTIETWVQQTKVKTYRIGYSVSVSADLHPIRSSQQIDAIQECAPDSTDLGGGTEVCKPVTTFDYNAAGTAYENNYFAITSAASSPIVLDVNGDGRDDIVFHGASEPGGPGGPHDIRTAISIWRGADPTNQATFLRYFQNVPGECFEQSGVIDLNGDGREDIVSLCNTQPPNSTEFSAYLSTDSVDGPRWVEQPLGIPRGTTITSLLADYDGDGEKDLVACRRDKPDTDPPPHLYIHVYQNTGTGFDAVELDKIPTTTCKLNAFDVDGDGDEDLIDTGSLDVVWRAEPYIRRWDPVFDRQLPPSGWTLADLNGDGLKDIVSLTGDSEQLADGSYIRSSVWVWFNTGKKFVPQLVRTTDPAGAPAELNGSIVVMDVDGDGSEDILANGRSGSCSVTNGCERQGTSIGRLVDRGRIQVVVGADDFPSTPVQGNPQTTADLNGDGSPELIFSHLGSTFTFATQGSAFGNLLRRVTDGLGRQDEVQYLGHHLRPDASDLTPTYIQAPCIATNVQCMKRVGPLVSDHHVRQVDSISGSTKPGASTSYTYRGAVSEEGGGQGWLGFKQRIVEDSLSRVTIDYHTGDAVMAGLPIRREVVRWRDGSSFSLAGSRSDVTDYAWSPWTTQSTNPDAPHFVFLQSVTQTAYSRDSYFVRTQTLNAVDSFNNIVESVTSVSTPDDIISETHTVSPRFNDVYGHHIGLVDYVETTNTRNGSSAIAPRKTRFEYDSRGLTTAVIRHPDDPESSAYRRTDLSPNELGVIDAACITTSDGEDKKRCVSIELDGWSIFPKSITAVEANLTTEYTYGAEAGELLVRTDPNGVTSEYGYDAFGRLSYVMEPTREGAVSYEQASRQASTFSELDVWGASRVKTFFRGEGQTTTTYDSFGRGVSFVVPGLDDQYVSSETSYDEFGRALITSLPHLPGSTKQGLRRYGYDQSGALQAVTGPDNSVTGIETVDRWNVDPAHDYWFDDVDAIEARVVTLPRGNRKVSVYDDAGAVVRTFDDPIDLGGEELTTRFVHGAFGVLTSVATPKDYTTFYPDVLGRPTIISNSNTGERQRDYSGFDEVVLERDANGEAVTFEYDGIGRLLRQLDSADGIIARWDYDGASGRGEGRPFRSFRRSAPGETTGIWKEYEYETGPRGRPLATTYRIGAEESSPDEGGETFRTGVSYRLDLPARIERVNYPDNGGNFSVERSYDVAGGLRSTYLPQQSNHPFWLMVSTDEGLRPKVEQFGNNVQTTRTYHYLGESDNTCTLDASASCAPGRLARLETRNAQGALLQDLGISNDRNGNVRSLAENVQGLGVRHFEYDGHDRLTREQVQTAAGLAEVKRYEYDPVGNLYKQTGLPEFSITPTGRLSAVGDTEYNYDGNGNQIERIGSLVSGGYQAFDLNEAEMPWHITQGENGNERDVYFEYDADDQRVVKREQLSSGVKVTVTIGDVYERVTRPSGVEHHYKVYGGTGQAAEVTRDAPNDDGTVVYLHPDHLGSPRALTDATGATIEARAFTPYGQEAQAINWDSTGVASGFTGHTHDEELGLINMKGRLYDPVVGRFTSADPFVANPLSSLGWDRYAYVEGNPLKFVDPSGFQSEGGDEVRWDLVEHPSGPVFVSTGPTKPQGPSISGSRQGQGALGGAGSAPTSNPAGGAGDPAPVQTVFPGPAAGPMGGGPAMGQPSISPVTGRPGAGVPALAPTSLGGAPWYAPGGALGQLLISDARIPYTECRAFGFLQTDRYLAYAQNGAFAIASAAAWVAIWEFAVPQLFAAVGGGGLFAGGTLAAERGIVASDLGLSGKGIVDLTGTVVDAGTTRIISVANITAVRGALVSEARGALPTILNAARAAGVQTLQISATFANAGLAKFAASQAALYGGYYSSAAGQETLTFILGAP